VGVAAREGEGVVREDEEHQEAVVDSVLAGAAEDSVEEIGVEEADEDSQEAVEALLRGDGAEASEGMVAHCSHIVCSWSRFLVFLPSARRCAWQGSSIGSSVFDYQQQAKTRSSLKVGWPDILGSSN